MTTFDTDVQSTREPQAAVPAGERLRATLVTGDDNLRGLVFGALQEDGPPISVDLDLSVPAQHLEPEHLERIRSSDPHVVILDMDQDPERAIRVAAAIAAGSPRAALVGVGPGLEASVLLEAMRAGLVEYVTRPAETHDLSDALGRVMRKQGWSGSQDGHRNGKLMAFFSAKGGSGSTTVMTNVGIELHRITGRKTLLVDLDLELGEIASLMGVRPRFHFVDLVRNFHRMDADLLPSYIESHESGVHVLSAPFEPEYVEEVTGEQIARVLGFLRSHYDYVLVDTSKSLAPPALAALQAADPIFLVTNMDVPSLRNLKRCLPILERVTAGDAERLRLVVNRFNAKSLVGLRDLEETLGIEVSWTLTNDYQTVIQAISAGQPLVLHGKSRYGQELKALARDVAHGAVRASDSKGSFVGRLLSPFRAKSARTTGTPMPLNSTPVEASTHG
jgi:pilus assembly protein CpaE